MNDRSLKSENVKNNTKVKKVIEFGFLPNTSDQNSTI